MPKSGRPQFGDLPPRYSFILNPYPDMRISSCPFCERKTGQRKLPLMIHVSPQHPVALNYTCRYCQHCDLLVAHKHEIEHLLTGVFSQLNPEVIGNEYLILGTMEKQAWQENMRHPKPPAEMFPHISQFADYYKELRVTRPGWYPRDQEPPIWEPPASREWVKAGSGKPSLATQ
jgi:hypothetical protein